MVFGDVAHLNPMTEAKAEITLKFSELPEAKPLPNKKVEIELTDQNGLTFTVALNAKSWRKAESNAAEFESWAGMVSGKLGKTDNVFEVLDAGVQIFEKKAKLPLEEEATA